MTTAVENKISKAKRNFLIAGTAVAIAISATSCTETEVEPITPKTITYAITGDPGTYAVVYNEDWLNRKTGPYLEPGQRVIDMSAGYAELEFVANPGDSVSVFVMDASYHGHKEVANVIVTVGNIVVARGDTKETGFFIIHGIIGKDLFKSCNKK